MAPPIDPPAPCDVLPYCPICGGKMELVYDRLHQKVCVCTDCYSGLTVPQTAWEIAKAKREVAIRK